MLVCQVCVHPGCSHRDQSLCGLEMMEIYLSWFWRLGKSKSGCLEIQCLLRAHFRCPCVVAGVREQCGSFHKGANPFHAGLTLMPWSFPMAPPPNTNTVGIRPQCMNFEEKNIVYSMLSQMGCLKNRNKFSHSS